MVNRIAVYWRSQKALLGIGLAVFVVGMASGFFFFEQFHEAMVLFVQELENSIDFQARGFALFTALLINNVTAAFVMMITGVFFGIYPVIALWVNGMAIGYMLQLASMQGGNPVSLFIRGILPHGIFEITAIVIAAAFGMRLGLLVFEWLAGLFRPQAREDRRRWGPFLRQLPLTINLVVILLIIAAGVESTITFRLMESIPIP